MTVRPVAPLMKPSTIDTPNQTIISKRKKHSPRDRSPKRRKQQKAVPLIIYTSSENEEARSLAQIVKLPVEETLPTDISTHWDRISICFNYKNTRKHRGQSRLGLRRREKTAGA